LKKSILFLSAIIVCNLIATAQLPKHYRCIKTKQSIKIDGRIEEAAWEKANWTDSFLDIEGDKMPQPAYETKVKMLWDDEYLYIAAYLEEPHIWATLQQRDTVIFYDNDFEVFIDPDSDGKFYAELEINAFGTEWDLLLNKPYSKQGIALNQFDIEGLKTAVHIEGTINKMDDKDRFWSIEIAIPFESLKYLHEKNIIPKNNEVWRLNFSRVQWHIETFGSRFIKMCYEGTVKEMPEQNWVWSPQGEINMHIPQKWGYLLFQDFNLSEKLYNREDLFYLENSHSQKHWIWMHDKKDFSTEDWENAFAKIRNAGFDAVLLGAGLDRLNEIIPLALLKGLEIHAWMWTLNCNDKKIIENHPDWYNVNRNGDTSYNKPAYVPYYKWLCPSNMEAREYVNSKVNELSKIKGLAGMHLDYIRHPDVILPIALQPTYGIVQDKEYPEYDYCYCENCKSRFRKEYGLSVDEMDDPTQSKEWKEFRYSLIKEVVEGANQHVSPDKELSAAVFPTPLLARKLVMQGWDDWPLDLVFPMIYHNFYDEDIEWIGESVKAGVDSIVFPLYAGLYIPTMNAEEMKDAINVALKNGAKGISVFDYNAIKDEHWKVLKEVLNEQIKF